MAFTTDAALLGAAGAGGGGPAKSSYIACGHSTSPYISVYPWDVTTGFGTKFSDPATLPAGNCYGVCWSPDSKVLVTYSSTSPYVRAYPFSAAGFGTAYSNPAVLPRATSENSYNPSFSKLGTAVAFPMFFNTPYVIAYSWDNSTGFGAKYADPAVALPNHGKTVDFHPNNDAIAVTHYNSPYISAYAWSESTGFGTKYSNPAVLPGSTGQGVRFSPTGGAVVTTTVSGTTILAYAWDSSTGFGTKYADPSPLGAQNGGGISFSPAGDFFSYVYGSAPRVYVYLWSDATGFGTRYQPATYPDSTSADTSVSADGLAVSNVASTSGNIPWAWPFDPATGFGTAYSAPSIALTGVGRSVAFSPT